VWTDKTKASAFTAFQPAHCRRMTRARAQVPGTTWPRRSGTPRCRHTRRRMCLGDGARLYGAKAICGNACSQTGKYRPSGLSVCIISSRIGRPCVVSFRFRSHGCGPGALFALRLVLRRHGLLFLCPFQRMARRVLRRPLATAGAGLGGFGLHLALVVALSVGHLAVVDRGARTPTGACTLWLLVTRRMPAVLERLDRGLGLLAALLWAPPRAHPWHS